MSIKVGVQGRVILGPMGGPGKVEVPLRYAIVREGPEPKTVVTKFKRIPVVVAPEQSHVQFGFDEIGDRNEKRPAKSAKKPAPRQP